MKKAFVLVLALFLSAEIAVLGEEPPKPVKLDAFDQQEIQKYHDTAVKAIELRDRLIEMASRRYKVDLKKFDYDILTGEFRVKPLEDKADAKK